MIPLHFPEFKIRTRLKENGEEEIFDIIRKKHVALTPEEWVRQHVVHYLIEKKNVPSSLIGVEKGILINNKPKRFDVVVFSKQGNPLLLVECKSPDVKITQSVFDQAARYNLILNATYFFITNGLQHYQCKIDYMQKKYNFMEDLPTFFQMNEEF